MKNKQIKWLLLGLLVVALGCFFLFNKSSKTQVEHFSFYNPISIQKTNANMPYFKIKIGEKTVPIGLDLGSTAYMSLYENMLQEIDQKSFLTTSWKMNFKGNRYERNVYKVPKIKINNLVLHDLPVEEASLSSEQEMTIVSHAYTADPIAGVLGWKFFKDTVLFLDMENSSIIWTDSLKTLVKNGHSLDGFTQTPLSTDRHLVECKAITSDGSFQLTLDTGLTYNVLNTDTNEPAAELIQDKNKFTTFSSFKMGDQELGPITFRPLSIKLPIDIQAALGMDFFDTHRVLIDFRNQQIYFAKNT